MGWILTLDNSTFVTMTIERNIFHLKFGMGRPAIDMWSHYLNRIREEDPSIHVRLLTDLSGRGYALIPEQEFETFADAEPSKCRLVNRPDWIGFYERFVPLCAYPERTYYRLRVSF